MSVRSFFRDIEPTRADLPNVIVMVPIMVGMVMAFGGLILSTIFQPDTMLLFWEGLLVFGSFVALARWIGEPRDLHVHANVAKFMNWLKIKAPVEIVCPPPLSAPTPTSNGHSRHSLEDLKPYELSYEALVKATDRKVRFGRKVGA